MKAKLQKRGQSKRSQHIEQNRQFCCSRKSTGIVVQGPSVTLCYVSAVCFWVSNLTALILHFLICRMEMTLAEFLPDLVKITYKKHRTEFLMHSNNKFQLNNVPDILAGSSLFSVIFCVISQYKQCESQNKYPLFFFFSVSGKCKCLGFLFCLLSK